MKKRILSLLVALMVIVSALPVCINAEGAPTYVLQNETVTVGNEFTMTVSIANNPGIISLRFEIGYDAEKLQLLSVSNLGLLAGYTTPAPQIASPYTLRWADSLATVNNDANGDVATLKFKALAVTDATNVSITHKEARNATGTKQTFADVTATVKVNCAHELTSHERNEPDHSKAGNIAYWTCDICEKFFSDSLGKNEITEESTILAKIAHEYSNEWSKDETQHWKECSCGDKTDVGSHNGGEATCVAQAICDDCGQSYGDFGDHVLSHHDKVEPSHTKAGNIEYWTCDTCKKFFSDSLGKNEISEENTILTMIPHKYPDDWSKDETQHWKECGCGNIIDAADHVYDNACDTTCNVCNYEREITHAYSKVWSYDENQHWHECSVCHVKTDVGTHNGGEATCLAQAICDDCGQSYGDFGDHVLSHHDKVEPSHTKAGNIEYWTCDTCKKFFSDSLGKNEISEENTILTMIPHEYSNEWSKDENKHWKECVCGTKTQESDHKYDNACDTICNTCGYKREITHAYNEAWSYDENQHWHECSVCHDKTDVSTHNGGEATCQSQAICDDCEQPYGDFANHNFVENIDDKYLASEANCISPALYYKSCSVCGEKSDETFASGLVNPDKHTGETYLEGEKDASCIEEGYTGDTYCVDCNVKIADGETIDKTEHIPSSKWSHDETHHWKECQTDGCDAEISKAEHSGGEATCIAKAVCEICETEYGEVDTNNHKNTEIINAKPATEEEEGYTGDIYCNDCKKTIKTGEPIKKLDHTHNLEHHTANESSCTKEGNTEYWYCTKCKKYYSDEKAINEISFEETVTEKKEHKFIVLQHDSENHWYKCENCDATDGVKCHDFEEIVDLKFLKSAPTCKKVAVYYKSCPVCGEMSDETFTSGDVDPDNHVGETYIVDDKEATYEEEGYTGDVHCSDCDALITSGRTIPKKEKDVEPTEAPTQGPSDPTQTPGEQDPESGDSDDPTDHQTGDNTIVLALIIFAIILMTIVIDCKRRYANK